METIIKVTHKPAYGVQLYAPANDLAIKLLELLHRKNFTREQLQKLKSIGFSVDIASEEI